MLWLRVIVESFATIVVALARVLSGRAARGTVALKPGDPAPAFALAGSDGRVHRLSDYRSSAVVLVWFPRAFTGGCTVQCRALARDAQAWRRFAAQVFAVSVDTPERAASFARAIGLEVPVLSDPTGDVARQYGVMGLAGFPHRWTFYIGADGRILDIDRAVVPSTHGADIAQRLKALGVPQSA